jgi:hypothetical protein
MTPTFLASFRPLTITAKWPGFIASGTASLLVLGASAFFVPSCASSYSYAYGDGSGGYPYDWKVLLNRDNLEGWKPFLGDSKADAAATWSVKDSVLFCTGTPTGYLATVSEYTNFELELEWCFDPKKGAGNSGVLLRVQKADQIWPRSMEAQLESRHAGDIWNIGDFPAKVDAARTQGRHTIRMGECAEAPLGVWNRYRIVMIEGRLEMYVNGELQNVATDVAVLPGRIALQSEGSYIMFRNIRVRDLGAKGATENSK